MELCKSFFIVVDEQDFSTSFKEQTFAELELSLAQTEKELRERHREMVKSFEKASQKSKELTSMKSAEDSNAAASTSLSSQLTGVFSDCLLSSRQHSNYIRKMRLEKPVYGMSKPTDEGNNDDSDVTSDLERSEEVIGSGGELFLWEKETDESDEK